jgi:hypothetical protein
MPTFQIVGRGNTSGRKRGRSVRVVDRANALKLMEAEDTLVDECVELPYPPASPELRDYVLRLGLSLSHDASHPECVFEVLRWYIVHRRCARIRYLTDVDGTPWRPVVEPHGFHRSREGFRLRCYLPPAEHEPLVVSDFQIAGWHLYLIEDIEQIEATDVIFNERPYRRTDDDAPITISFTAAIAPTS